MFKPKTCLTFPRCYYSTDIDSIRYDLNGATFKAIYNEDVAGDSNSSNGHNYGNDQQCNNENDMDSQKFNLRVHSIPLAQCLPSGELFASISLWQHYRNENLFETACVLRDYQAIYIGSRDSKNIVTLAEYISGLQFYCEDDCRSIIRQICLGIKALHSFGTCHLHLTPNNIYIRERGSKVGFDDTNRLAESLNVASESDLSNTNIQQPTSRESIARSIASLLERRKQDHSGQSQVSVNAVANIHDVTTGNAGSNLATDDHQQSSAVISQNEPQVLIGDYLLSHFLDGPASLLRSCKNSIYSAPEVLKGESYSTEPDIFAIGALTLLMLTGKELTTAKDFVDDLRMKMGLLPVEQAMQPSGTPTDLTGITTSLSGAINATAQSRAGQRMQSSLSARSGSAANQQMSTHMIYAAIYRSVFMSSASITAISKNSKSFLLKALDTNPRTRMTIDECLAHPWFQSELRGVSTPLLLARRAFTKMAADQKLSDSQADRARLENDIEYVRNAILDAKVYEDYPEIERFLLKD